MFSINAEVRIRPWVDCVEGYCAYPKKESYGVKLTVVGVEKSPHKFGFTVYLLSNGDKVGTCYLEKWDDNAHWDSKNDEWVNPNKKYSFMNFEEFMRLHVQRGKDTRVIQHMDAQMWLNYYETAKTSYEKYGDNFPVPSKVMTLWGGHGGRGNDIRYLLDNNSTEEIVYLYQSKDQVIGTYPRSIVEKKYWWTQFKVIENAKN